MINPHDNYWIPDDGFKHITNGEVFTNSIYLGKNDSIDNWHDTNDEPPEPDDPGTVEDKAAAYDILMGVSE